MQDASWKFGEVLGNGCTGSVMATTSCHYSNVVLKQGSQEKIQAEAGFLWRMQHPSVVRVYSLVEARYQVHEDFIEEYMALERLGPSLRSKLDGEAM